MPCCYPNYRKLSSIGKDYVTVHVPKLASRAGISEDLFVQPGSWFLLFCLDTQRPPGHRVEPPASQSTTILSD